MRRRRPTAEAEAWRNETYGNVGTFSPRTGMKRHFMKMALEACIRLFRTACIIVDQRLAAPLGLDMAGRCAHGAMPTMRRSGPA